MSLNKVTLTGADDGVNTQHLQQMCREYAFVEHALLFSFSKMGTPRYPSFEKLDEFVSALPANSLAVHFCGRSVFRWLEIDSLVRSLTDNIARIQLNFNVHKIPPEVNGGQFIKDIMSAATESRVAFPHTPPIITQHNINNINIYHEHMRLKHSSATSLRFYHHFLFDRSGGQGKLPDTWPVPFHDEYCGYAGGLNADNVKEQLDKICELAGDQPFWIDMESGIRTNNQFDIDKCIKVLEVVKPYIR